MNRCWLVAAVAVLSVSSVVAESERAKAARREVTQGVKYIDSEGLPGPVLCLCDDAFPIGMCQHWEGTKGFAGAGAFYGEGRVVYLGHPGYLTAKTLADTGTLITNAVRWLSKGKENPTIVGYRNGEIESKFAGLGIKVTTVSSWDEAAKADVVVTTTFPMEETAQMTEYVKRGGAILGAGLGWGWKQFASRVGGASLGVNFGDNQVLGPMGILMGDMGTPKPDGEKHFPVLDEYPDGTFTIDALTHILRDDAKDKKLKKQCQKIVSLTLDAMPANAAQEAKDLMAKFATMPGADKQPTPQDPIGPNDFTAKLAQIAKKNAWQADPVKVWPADPAHVVYPGAVKPGAEKLDKTVTVDCKWPRWHFTGLYSPAGEPLTVTLPEGAEKLGLSLRIGTTTEDITTAQEFWKRAPMVAMAVPLNRRETTLSTPYGGLVYVVVPDWNGKIKDKVVDVKVSGGIMAPWFKLGRDTNDDFRRQLDETHAPMGEIEGPWFSVTLPTKDLAKCKDAKWIAEYWEKVMEGAKYVSQLKERKHGERICGDLQLECGLLHNGYPLMFHLSGDEGVVDRERMTRGEGWGFYHEIGHNHQNAEWTPDGTGEVTVNIFTCYTIEKVCGQNMRNKRFISSATEQAKRVNSWIARGKTFEGWKGDYFVALEVYLRIAEAFGWDVYPKTFAKYLEPGVRHPKNDQEKWELFAERLSEVTGVDMATALAAWSIPIPEAARKECAKYPPAPESITVGVDSKYVKEEGDTYLYVPDGAKDAPEAATGMYVGVSLVDQPTKIEQYASREAIPGGEQDIRWKTDWLLMRRIEATNGPVTLGAPENRNAERQVELTRPYYIAVYELTQKQWYNIMGDWLKCAQSASACREVRPQGNTSYEDMRGSLRDGIDWPKTDGKVSPESVMGKLRALTGYRINFDIPSEAEWEVACRAGSTNYWNDGSSRSPYRPEGYKLGEADHNLDRLGRYCQNGGELPGKDPKAPDDCGPEHGTAIVGSYQPNAWGLYDMHGNMREHCRDWLEPDVKQPGLSGKDPKGPESESPRAKSRRVQKGGSYANFLYGGPGAATAGERGFGSLVGTGTRYGSTGVRLMMPAQIWAKPRTPGGQLVLSDAAQAARTRLLRGVTAITPCGLASPVVCLDAAAVPIVSGKFQDNTLGLAVAASFCGKGRVVVVGDECGPDAFCKRNPVFAENAEAWLEENAPRAFFVGPKTSARFVDLNALEEGDVAGLVEFVRNGGGLFLTGCAWKWQGDVEERTGIVKPLVAWPGNMLLKEFGLGLAGDGLRWTSGVGFLTRGAFGCGMTVPDAQRLRKGKTYRDLREEGQVAHTLQCLAELQNESEENVGIPSETRILPRKPYPKNANGIAVASGDKIAFLGDSITRLGGDKDGWIDKVLAGLEKAGVTDVEADRAGWDGQHSGDMLNRINELLGRPGVTWICIMCGGNDAWGFDWQRGLLLPEYRRNVRKMLDRAAAAGVHVILLTPTFVGEDLGNEKNRIVRSYQEFCRAEAKARGILLADVAAAEEEGILKKEKKDVNLYTYDGVHPVQAGHELFARTILKALGCTQE